MQPRGIGLCIVYVPIFVTFWSSFSEPRSSSTEIKGFRTELIRRLLVYDYIEDSVYLRGEDHKFGGEACGPKPEYIVEIIPLGDELGLRDDVNSVKREWNPARKKALKSGTDKTSIREADKLIQDIMEEFFTWNKKLVRLCK